jgi:hypothetical protein
MTRKQTESNWSQIRLLAYIAIEAKSNLSKLNHWLLSGSRESSPVLCRGRHTYKLTARQNAANSEFQLQGMGSSSPQETYNCDEDDLSNYRPRPNSHLSFLSKITERVVKIALQILFLIITCLLRLSQSILNITPLNWTTLLAVHFHIIKATCSYIQQQITCLSLNSLSFYCLWYY